jgi:hypothetical protein
MSDKPKSNSATAFVLPPELREKAREVQKLSGASLGAIIRVALSKYVIEYLEREKA